jgi:hypothetical protein
VQKAVRMRALSSGCQDLPDDSQHPDLCPSAVACQQDSVDYGKGRSTRPGAEVCINVSLNLLCGTRPGSARYLPAAASFSARVSSSKLLTDRRVSG